MSAVQRHRLCFRIQTCHRRSTKNSRSKPHTLVVHIGLLKARFEADSSLDISDIPQRSRVSNNALYPLLWPSRWNLLPCPGGGLTHHTTLYYAVLQHTTLHCTTAQCTAPHNTTQHCTTAHYTTLHYSTLQCTTEHNITLYYGTLHYTALQHSALHHRTLHYAVLQHTTLHCTTAQCTAPQNTTLHCTTTHYTTLHYS